MEYEEASLIADLVKLKNWLAEHQKTWRDIEADEEGQFICVDIKRTTFIKCEEKIYIPKDLI